MDRKADALRMVLALYSDLTKQRRSSALPPQQLSKLRTTCDILCHLTGDADSNAAFERATRLLAEIEAGGTWPEPAVSQELTQHSTGPLPPCVACSRPLPDKVIELGLKWHRGCRPVRCLGCEKPFPAARLIKLRCPTCLCRPKAETNRRKRARRKAQGRAVRAVRQSTPMELANRERQAEQRREAKRLSALSPGPVSQEPPRAVVVRAGLPGLGKRR